MKKLLVTASLMLLAVLMNAQATVKTIPVTTSSKKALLLYNEAMTANQDVDLNKFNDLISKALSEDPDFFMAYYQKAIFALYINQEKDFLREATAAVNCKSKLSSGEKILKDALKILLEDRKADLRSYGKKLVEMYPEDVNSYIHLMGYQYLIKDFDGQIATLNEAIKLQGRKDYLYNALGYAYMGKGQFREAESALDTYISLSPNLPNPYDSKGDLYMLTKDYGKAYENFMKANSIDTAWSKAKMVKAKSLAGIQENKQAGQVQSMNVTSSSLFEQKFNRVIGSTWYFIGLSVKLAMEDGIKPYEYGKRMGQFAALTWGKEEFNLAGLVKGWAGNCSLFQRAGDSAPQIRENTDGSVSIIADDRSIHDFFQGSNPIIQYDDFLEYWRGLIDVIAARKGATLKLEHQDSLMVYTFIKK